VGNRDGMRRRGSSKFRWQSFQRLSEEVCWSVPSKIRRGTGYELPEAPGKRFKSKKVSKIGRPHRKRWFSDLGEDRVKGVLPLGEKALGKKITLSFCMSCGIASTGEWCLGRIKGESGLLGGTRKKRKEIITTGGGGKTAAPQEPGFGLDKKKGCGGKLCSANAAGVL